MKIRFTKSHSPIYPFYLRQRFTSSNKMKAGFGRQVTHLLFVLCTLSFVLVQSCNTTEPPITPPEKPKAVKLKLIDVSTTEAFINLSASDTVLPVRITLNKDDKALFNFTLTKTDTTVIDTTLQAGKIYIYQTAAVIDGEEQKGDTLQVKTLDTTSNNFTWQSFTFGDLNAGSSILRDVAVISDDNIYAVGEIYLKDSTGQADPLPYNEAHWDGTEWELKRISVKFRGNNITPSLDGIFAFSSQQIWVVGGLAIFGDGNNWTPYDVRQITGYDSLSFTKCWGTNPNNMYFSGLKGSLAHYQNGSWQKIESGTETIINDIWGLNSLTSNNPFVLAAVSDRHHSGDYKLLSISGTIANDTLSWQFTRLYGLWFGQSREIYVVGDGVHLYKNNKWETINLTNNFTTRVKATALNDIYITGCCNTMFHFNGMRWQQITGIYGNFEGLDVKGNLAASVGWSGSKAIILIGRRHK